MSKILKFNVYSDPGHGWVAAKRNLLRELGLLDKISRFSYQRGGTVYLEEDADAGLLFSALDAKGVEYEFIEKVSRENYSPIRSYDDFRND